MIIRFRARFCEKKKFRKIFYFWNFGMGDGGLLQISLEEPEQEPEP